VVAVLSSGIYRAGNCFTLYVLSYFLLILGVINMSQVLQRQMDQELELVEGKGGGAVLGKVRSYMAGYETSVAQDRCSVVVV
jgi:hypothetical protein